MAQLILYALYHVRVAVASDMHKQKIFAAIV